MDPKEAYEDQLLNSNRTLYIKLQATCTPPMANASGDGYFSDQYDRMPPAIFTRWFVKRWSLTELCLVIFWKAGQKAGKVAQSQMGSFMTGCSMCVSVTVFCSLMTLQHQSEAVRSLLLIRSSQKCNSTEASQCNFKTSLSFQLGKMFQHLPIHVQLPSLSANNSSTKQPTKDQTSSEETGVSLSSLFFQRIL